VDQYKTNDRRVEKTAAGNIKAADLKAIQWYMIEHNLKPVATNIFPNFQFVDKLTGDHVTHHLADIQDAYKEFKASTHGRRKKAA
jgi:hypothetical protein